MSDGMESLGIKTNVESWSKAGRVLKDKVGQTKILNSRFWAGKYDITI
jgi:hypothetical protein